MAKSNRSPTQGWSPDPLLYQPELLTVVSKICASRQDRPDPRVCRLIIDSRLQWETEPIDGHTSWLYLPAPARLRHKTGCLIVSVD